MADSIETKQAKFTPGPWAVDANGFIYHRPDPLTKYVIAIMESGSEGDEEMIAAAPDMLAALKAVADDAVLIGNGESAISLSTRRLVETLLCRLEG